MENREHQKTLSLTLHRCVANPHFSVIPRPLPPGTPLDRPAVVTAFPSQHGALRTPGPFNVLQSSGNTLNKIPRSPCLLYQTSPLNKDVDMQTTFISVDVAFSSSYHFVQAAQYPESALHLPPRNPSSLFPVMH